MNKREFFYPSADGITNIHGVCWEPEHISIKKFKGIILIAHGVTEYIHRYENFAKCMTDAGYLVAGNDILGHGESISEQATPMYFGGVGSWDYLKEDLLALKRKMQQELAADFGDVKSVPCYMLGFSLGSFILRDYLISYPEENIKGALILGTGQTPKPQIALAKWIANRESKKYGDAQQTQVIRKLTFGTYNKGFAPNKTDFDWLCANEESLMEYMNDPHRGEGFTPGLFREMLNGMAKVGNWRNVELMNKEIPVLFLSGMDDSVGEKGKGVKRAYESFQEAGMKYTQMKLYPGMRHDILREGQWKTVVADILAWLESIG